jgi:tRNA-dihydrouridine synthase A
MSQLSRTFCVAPMMDWTDRHCRFFHRLLSARALLYTEMVTAQAILHGDRERLLGFSREEHPVALQLGGSDPVKLAEAAAIGEGFGYGEINLNVGCPSDRVQEGSFGACLMAEPELVARCVAAMGDAVRVPVTVKCRIGIDDQDSEADLERFVAAVAGAGCRTFIVHARKAWLQGLSPKENREIPPLDYARVYRLKAAHPELEIILNGGITSLEQTEVHLHHVDGVALGRAAYQNPYLLADVDRRLFGATDDSPARRMVIEQLIPYAEKHLATGGRLNNIARHILGLYHGRPRARIFRRHIAEQAPRPGAGATVLLEAMRLTEGEAIAPLLAAAE